MGLRERAGQQALTHEAQVADLGGSTEDRVGEESPGVFQVVHDKLDLASARSGIVAGVSFQTPVLPITGEVFLRELILGDVEIKGHAWRSLVMLIQDRGEHLRHVDINAHEGRQLLVGLGVSAWGQTGQIPEHLIGLGRKKHEMPNVVVQ